MSVASGRYQFNVTDETVVAAVTQKARQDEQAIAELVSSGVAPVKTVYHDGGSHESFVHRDGGRSRVRWIARGRHAHARQVRRRQPSGRPVLRPAGNRPRRQRQAQEGSTVHGAGLCVGPQGRGAGRSRCSGRCSGGGNKGCDVGCSRCARPAQTTRKAPSTRRCSAASAISSAPRQTRSRPRTRPRSPCLQHRCRRSGASTPPGPARRRRRRSGLRLPCRSTSRPPNKSRPFAQKNPPARRVFCWPKPVEADWRILRDAASTLRTIPVGRRSR